VGKRSRTGYILHSHAKNVGKMKKAICIKSFHDRNYFGKSKWIKGTCFFFKIYEYNLLDSKQGIALFDECCKDPIIKINHPLPMTWEQFNNHFVEVV